MSLRLEDLRKSFTSVVAVDDVSLTVGHGESLALLGPSGCGKSTLLRLVAGLELPDGGKVFLSGKDVTALSPRKRGVGMVFQDYALFPHMNVAQNVGFALVEGGRHRRLVEERVDGLLDLVGLGGFERRRVYELSGGQQQRVALARALAAEPALLLLDEPLSNLDPGLRQNLQRELREVLSGVGVDALYVTHDRSEALAIAPRLAVMRAGKIVQQGPSEEVFGAPATTWTARFLGYSNVFSPNSPIARGTPLLLKDELVTLDGNLPALVEAVEPDGHRLRLSLWVPEWQERISWEGYRRELPTEVTEGAELLLEVPERAWLELEEG